jgi:hypothetical protein
MGLLHAVSSRADELETENLLWQKTHQNFKNVMTEMAEMADRVLQLEEAEQKRADHTPSGKTR